MRKIVFLFSVFFIFSGCANTLNRLRKETDQRIIQQEAKLGKIDIGMTTEEVEASWGYPNDINKSSWGHEQWVYGFCDRHFCKHTYLYFENNKLTSWQD